MKIEKITDNKIRIILNLEDLKAKNIDLHSLMSNSIESQSLFVDMLDEAEKELGFYTNDSKISVEALASADGVFIFTITKVDEEVTKRKTLKIKRKSTNINNQKAIYKFNSFEELCNYCTYINDNKTLDINSFSNNSSLYFYNNNYYLVFSNIDTNYSNIKKVYASLSEFAKNISKPEIFECKLLEYGKLIMKRNAINRFIKFFI